MIERPEGFENDKRDCTVRALSLAANLPYKNVHSAFEVMGRKDRQGTYGKKVLQGVCRILEIKAIQVKRSGTLKKFLIQNPKGNFWCLKRGHAFAIIDGVVHDEKNENCHIKGCWLITKAILCGEKNE